MSLQSLLTRLILVCVVPLILLAASLAVISITTEHAERKSHAEALAKNVADTIDQHLKARIGALEILAASPLLDHVSLRKDFYREAQGFYRSFGSHVVLGDAKGHMLLNTRVPFGTKLPMLPRPKGQAAAPAAVATGKTFVGDIFYGPVAHEPLVAIASPVMHNDEAVYVLITVFETRRFRERLDQTALPAGWSLALLDSHNGVISRRSPPGLNPEEDVDPSGRFIARSSVSPWSVVVEIPRAVYLRPIIEAAIILAFAILVITLVSILGGMFVARRIGRAVAHLAEEPASGSPLPDIAEIADVRRRLDALAEERTAAEVARKESEERYRLIAENTSDVIWLMDISTGRFTYVSPSVERIRGYKPDEIVGQTLEHVLPPETYAWVSKALCERIARFEAGDESLRTDVAEIPQLRKDGSLIAMEVATTFITGDNGRVIMMLGVNRDITERKEAEDRLRESEEKHRIVADFTSDWEYWLDSGGRFRYISPAVESVTGYTVAEFQEDPDLIFKILHPDNRDIMNDHLQATHNDQPDPVSLEFRITTKSGEERWISHTCVPVYLDDGTYAGRRSGNRDITESKRAEKEKAKLREQLIQAQKMESVGRLAGGVAHDFNNKLSVIIGFTDIILDEANPDESYYPYIKEIRSAAERSADLTRQLLAFARKQTVVPRILDLNEIVEGLLKMLHRLIGEDISLIWLPGRNLKPVLIDPSQVDQILANLCVNARDAIAGVGKITIETGNVHFDEAYCADHAGFLPGDYIRLAVSDDGSGMDKETLGKLFEPFFTTKEIGKGTGLGLATIYGIVGQNKGFINVYSEPGQGTTFRIYLPQYGTEAESVSIAEPLAGILSGDETILVVEDAMEILNMVKIMLEGQGYHVLATNSPEAAIRMVAEFDGKVHLLITDVVMPVMNGKDLARRLLALQPGLKHLFISGYTANVIAHRGILDEGVHFLQKPFSRKELAVKVREVLDLE